MTYEDKAFYDSTPSCMLRRFPRASLPPYRAIVIDLSNWMDEACRIVCMDEACHMTHSYTDMNQTRLSVYEWGMVCMNELWGGYD